MQTYRWLELIWLVPLLPLAGAAVMFFFGRRMPKKAVNAVCVGAVVLAFLLSTLAVWQLPAYSAANEGKPFQKYIYTWLGTDTGETVYQTHSGAPAQFRAEVGFLVDPLSA